MSCGDGAGTRYAESEQVTKIERDTKDDKKSTAPPHVGDLVFVEPAREGKLACKDVAHRFERLWHEQEGEPTQGERPERRYTERGETLQRAVGAKVGSDEVYERRPDQVYAHLLVVDPETN